MKNQTQKPKSRAVQVYEATKKVLDGEGVKFEIEVCLTPSGKIFLNYWNSYSGDDVNAELKNNKLRYYSGSPTDLTKFVNRVAVKVKRDTLDYLKKRIRDEKPTALNEEQ